MNPGDIATILTALAPIASSAASIYANNKSEEAQKGVTSGKTVNITINNHFYTSSEADAMKVASCMQNQLVDSLAASGNRYIL